MQVKTIGLDIAKSVFQVHGVDDLGHMVVQRRLKRAEMTGFFKSLKPCLIGIEACGTAHHWARELLRLGHQVRLIPTQYVKPYVKRSKTDAADAEAICEAVSRPYMRFVPVKSRDAQALGLLHRARSQLISQRTALINYLRAGLAEYGIVSSRGAAGAKSLREAAGSTQVPKVARSALITIAQAIVTCDQHVIAINRQLAEAVGSDEACARLTTIPGVGPVCASTILAVGGDLSRFASGRHFAAWLGLTPRQDSSGDKIRLGRITKAGDRTLRSLLVFSAFSVIRRAKSNPKGASPWLVSLLERRPTLVAAVALANKTARIAWALIVKGGTYRSLPAY